MATSQEYLREIAQRVDSIYTGALTDAANRLDVLERGQKMKCEECGTELIDQCLRCGAPQCCPKCCLEDAKLMAEHAAPLKHSKGPWKAEWGNKNDSHDSIITAKTNFVMEGEIYHKADAILMAAAPTLLEACKAAMAALSQTATFPADVEAAKRFLSAAISSTGVEQI